MIVCVCANVTDKQIIAILPAEVEEVMVKTNCAMNCGICFEAMLECMQKVAATVEPGLSSI